MSESSVAQDCCPLCGLALCDPPSDDHVFGQAFGAKRTVVTHKACNNALGSGAETSLHGATSMLNLARAIHGLAKLPIPGTTADGVAVATDLAKGEVWPQKPKVAVSRDADSVHVGAAGSEKQIRRVLAQLRKKLGTAIPTFDELPGDATQRVAMSNEISMTLTHDLPAAEQFAVKAALGAGTLAYGPEFGSCELAAALRAWAAEPFDNPLLEESSRPRLRLERLADLSAMYEQILQQMVPDATLPSLEPASGARNYQALFIPNSGSTILVVHVLGFPVMPWGLVVPAPLPKADPWGEAVAPVLVREHADGRLEVVHYTDLLMAPVLAAAAKAEAEMLAEDT